jgi:hypothetical protein
MLLVTEFRREVCAEIAGDENERHVAFFELAGDRETASGAA